MKKTYDSGTKSNVPKENLAWTKVMIGLYHFDRGEFVKAESHYGKVFI